MAETIVQLSPLLLWNRFYEILTAHLFNVAVRSLRWPANITYLAHTETFLAFGFAVLGKQLKTSGFEIREDTPRQSELRLMAERTSISIFFSLIFSRL